MERALLEAFDALERAPGDAGARREALRVAAHAGRLDEGVRRVRDALAVARRDDQLASFFREVFDQGWGLGDPLLQVGAPLAAVGYDEETGLLACLGRDGRVVLFHGATGARLVEVPPHAGGAARPAGGVVTGTLRAFPTGVWITYGWQRVGEGDGAEGVLTRVAPDGTWRRVSFPAPAHTPARWWARDDRGEVFRLHPERGPTHTVRVRWEDPPRVEELDAWPRGRERRGVPSAGTGTGLVVEDPGKAAVRLADAAGGGARPTPHAVSLHRIEVVGGGARLATHDLSGRVALWSLRDGSLLAAVDPGREGEARTACDPEGGRVLVAGPEVVRAFAIEEEGPVLAWARPVTDLGIGSPVRDVALGPRRAVVVAGRGDVVFLDAATGGWVGRVPVHLEEAQGCGLLEGEEERFWVRRDRYWDRERTRGPLYRRVEPGAEAAPLLGDVGDGPPVDVGAPAKRTALGLVAATQTDLQVLVGGRARVLGTRRNMPWAGAFAVDPAGQRVAWVLDGRLELFRLDAATGRLRGEPEARLEPWSRKVRDLAFTPDGGALLYTQACHVRTWRLPPGG